MEGSTQPTSSQNIVTAQDLLKRLRAGVQEVYTIRCRGFEAPVRILSNAEFNAIRRQANLEKARINGDETDKNLYMEKAVLKAASTVTQGGAASLSDKLLELLSLDEISFFYNEYIKILEDANPNVEKISMEEFRNLVETVKKKNVSANDCSLQQLRAIFYAFQELIQQPATQTSQTDSSSGGQQ